MRQAEGRRVAAARSRVRLALATAALLAGAVLAGCATWGGPRTIEVPRARLEQALAEQLPVDRRALDALDVRLDAPQLQLRPATNRIATELGLHLGERLLARPLVGTVALEVGLRYASADHTVRLTDVRVERIEVRAGASVLAWPMERAAARLAEQALDDLVVYRMRPDDVEAIAQRGIAPDAIRVTPDGLSITLRPSAPR